MDILEYLRKKAGPPAIPVSSLQEIEDFITSVHSDATVHMNLKSPHRAERSNQDPVDFDTDGLLAVALASSCPKYKIAIVVYMGPCARPYSL